jgi:hypothetical protein
MDDKDKIDFAALDPSRDPARWGPLVAQVAARGLARFQRRLAPSLAAQVVAWWRPALAMAAAVALVVWLGAGRRPPVVTASADPALEVARWAEGTEPASTAAMLDVLGAGDAAR